jgi:hypothetical protein
VGGAPGYSPPGDDCGVLGRVSDLGGGGVVEEGTPTRLIVNISVAVESIPGSDCLVGGCRVHVLSFQRILCVHIWPICIILYCVSIARSVFTSPAQCGITIWKKSLVEAMIHR